MASAIAADERYAHCKFGPSMKNSKSKLRIHRETVRNLQTLDGHALGNVGGGAGSSTSVVTLSGLCTVGCHSGGLGCNNTGACIPPAYPPISP